MHKSLVARNAKVWRLLALPVAVLLCAPQSALAIDKQGALQLLPANAARATPARGQPGLWQGRWEVTRDHPQITTRGGALALELDIEHSAGSATPLVKWAADRGLCELPAAPPCEWIGNNGIASSARVAGGHLLLVLQVSADESDPMVVWLERPQPGRSMPGALISAKGNLAYMLAVQRP